MATNGAQNIPTGVSGTVLQGQGVGTTSAFSTATYPSTAGTSGNVLTSDGTNWNSGAPATANPLATNIFVDDFFYSTAGLSGGWRSQQQNGGNFNNPVQPDSGHPGVVSIDTGTNSNGSAQLFLGDLNSSTLQSIVLGGGAIDIYWVIQLSAISNGIDTYELSVGLGDTQNTPNTSFDNGVFFNYSSTVNSGNWQGSTSSSTTKSVLNTSTAVGTGWTTLRININAGATLCTFYVAGSSQGTISTNIPTTVITPYASIAKSAGTSVRTCNIDLFYMNQTLTSSR